MRKLILTYNTRISYLGARGQELGVQDRQLYCADGAKDCLGRGAAWSDSGMQQAGSDTGSAEGGYGFGDMYLGLD